MPDITSRQHPLVKTFRAAAVANSRRAVLEGWHLLEDAVAAGVRVETVLISRRPVTAGEAALLTRIESASDVFTVTSAVMNAASPVRTPAGVVALAARGAARWSDTLVPAPALVVVAIDIQDPGNAGAIVRSAEAGGATGVILAGASADPWSWKALRAAMGSTFRLPVVQERDPAQAVASLREAGTKVIATVPRGGSSLYDADLRPPTALLLGGEGKGLDAPIVDAADHRIVIPMAAPVESLNVAVATGILVYEARRQRTTR